ncbi:MAG: polyhydroxyalkanoate synthesis repressor PhaR [Pseudomonadota bacterium]
MSKRAQNSDGVIVIKKYANRRLYNTSASTYVTLDDLAQMVKDGAEFVVKDAKSGEDITRTVLTQIIFEEENKGENLLPINFLRQLITFYGDSMQAVVPSYLEYSIESLSREQEKFQKQIADAFGTTAFPGMEEQVRQNMAIFQQTMQMFNPFAPQSGNQPSAEQPSAAEPKQASEGGNDELKGLQEQLKAMQAQIDKLAKGSD